MPERGGVAFPGGGGAQEMKFGGGEFRNFSNSRALDVYICTTPYITNGGI